MNQERGPEVNGFLAVKQANSYLNGHRLLERFRESLVSRHNEAITKVSSDDSENSSQNSSSRKVARVAVFDSRSNRHPRLLLRPIGPQLVVPTNDETPLQAQVYCLGPPHRRGEKDDDRLLNRSARRPPEKPAQRCVRLQVGLACAGALKSRPLTAACCEDRSFPGKRSAPGSSSGSAAVSQLCHAHGVHAALVQRAVSFRLAWRC